MIRSIIIAVGFLAFYSCESTDPGCLELNASNYDPFAVTECDSCCVYPGVSLNAVYSYDLIQPITFNRLYPFTEDDSVAIRELNLVFSEFVFYNDGEEYRIIDTLQGERPRLYDDYLTIEKAGRNRIIGQTDYVVTFDSVSFQVGFDKAAILALRPYEDLDQNSGLTQVLEKMYVDSTELLLHGRSIIQTNDSIRVLPIAEIGNQEVGFSADIELRPGIAWELPILINTRKVLEGIDVDGTNEMIAQTIGQNISNSISKR